MAKRLSMINAALCSLQLIYKIETNETEILKVLVFDVIRVSNHSKRQARPGHGNQW